MTRTLHPRGRRLAYVLAFASTTLPSGLGGQSAGEPWWSVLDTLPEGVLVLTVDSSYTVRGATPEEIALELAALGPRRDGESFHGLHQAPWRWRFRTERTGGAGCRVTEFSLVVRSVITLPHLATDQALPPGVRQAWDIYLANLRMHEEGHRRIALRELRGFRTRAAAALPRACDGFQAYFESMSREAEDRIRQAQETYDQDTGYGRSQGAVWPPPGREDGTIPPEPTGLRVPAGPGHRGVA